MSKYLIPGILLALTVALFWLFIDPAYQEAKALSAEAAVYDEALFNSARIQGKRDELLARYSTFDTAALSRLERLLPDTVDNVRLVLDINNIAGRYGLVIRSVNLSSPAKEPNVLGPENREFGTVILRFTVNATYSNFVAFIRDLEDSLRVVDIVDISFRTGDSTNTDYEVSLETYWLK